MISYRMTKLCLSLFGLLVLLVVADAIYAEGLRPKGMLTLVYQDVGVTASVSFACDWVVMAKGTMYWGAGPEPRSLTEALSRATGSRVPNWSWFMFQPFVDEMNANRPGLSARAISV